MKMMSDPIDNVLEKKKIPQPYERKFAPCGCGETKDYYLKDCPSRPTCVLVKWGKA